MKSQAAYIIVLIISIFLVIFAIENAEPVDVQFFNYQFTISLSLLIVLSIAIGTILSFIFSFSGFLRIKNNIKKKDSEIKKLKQELDKKETGIETETEESGDEEKETYDNPDETDSSSKNQ